MHNNQKNDKEKERVLIAGAGGFIGSHLAKRLHEQGHFVRAVDTKWDSYIPRERMCSQFLPLDLRSSRSCREAVSGIDWVFQLAANMGGIGYITSHFADVVHDNALINLNMLEAARKENVERYFFASSACIYPNFKQTESEVPGLREEDAMPADPNEPYGWEKLFTEVAVEAYHHDYFLDTRIARFHNIYGPEGTWQGGKEKAPAALCRKVAQADDGGVIEMWGNGTATRSFCYIDDCVEGTIALMKSDYTKALNIGSDRLISISELLDMIIRISGKKLSVVHNIGAPVGVQGRNADLKLVKYILGWRPTVELEDGMGRTYRWIEEQVKNSVEVA